LSGDFGINGKFVLGIYGESREAESKGFDKSFEARVGDLSRWIYSESLESRVLKRESGDLKRESGVRVLLS